MDLPKCRITEGDEDVQRTKQDDYTVVFLCILQISSELRVAPVDPGCGHDASGLGVNRAANGVW